MSNAGRDSGVKLDFPHFSREDPAGWVFKVSHYFAFYQTPPAQRFLMASYHIEGEALIWYHDAVDKGQFTCWQTFTQALQLCDDLMEALTKMKQTTTLAAYKGQFEAFSN